MSSKKYIVIFLYLTGLVSMCYAQKLLNLGIGPVWPKQLRNTEKSAAWNGTIEYGYVFDEKIAIGPEIDFMWNVIITAKDVDTSSSGSSQLEEIDEEEKRFMFPVSVFLSFDPVPKIIVHPVIKGQIGFNMMVYSNKSYNDTTKSVKKSKDSGFYIGVVGKASIDALWDMGEHLALFAGFEYQWCKVNNVKKKDSKRYYQKMNGPGIRMGLSFLF